MQAADLAKVELPEATLSLRAGQQQLVGEADPKDMPDSLCKISRSPDRDRDQGSAENRNDSAGLLTVELTTLTLNQDQMK